MHTSRNHETRPEPGMLSRPPARNLDSRLSAQANDHGINLSQTGRRMGRRTRPVARGYTRGRECRQPCSKSGEPVHPDYAR